MSSEAKHTAVRLQTMKPLAESVDSPEDRMRPLTPAERECRDAVYQRLLKVMDLSLIGNIEDKEARRQIREVCERLIAEERAPLSLQSRQRVIRRIEDEVLGLGPLEPLLADRTVSDILVNGSNQVYVERRGKLELTDVRFNNDAHLLNIIDRIVSAVGRRIDESSPMVDARLKDGSRVNAIMPPLALDGPVLSIRRFAVELLTIDDLIRLGSMTPEFAQVMGAIVKGRLNVLVSGGTGAGKTTLLESAVRVHSGERAHRHDRRLGRAAVAAASRRATGNASAEHRRIAVQSRSATSFATACGCGPTASCSARCAAAKRSTCCRR